jgi:hypothetical protein
MSIKQRMIINNALFLPKIIKYMQCVLMKKHAKQPEGHDT